MRWAADWTGFLQDIGNAEGSDAGDVVLELAAPVGGESLIRVSTNDVKAQVNGGELVGLTMILPGGRRAFIPWGNIAAILDAPSEE